MAIGAGGSVLAPRERDLAAGELLEVPADELADLAEPVRVDGLGTELVRGEAAPRAVVVELEARSFVVVKRTGDLAAGSRLEAGELADVGACGDRQ